MIRVVLVGRSESDWRISRQEQWMAEVRRNPASTSHPRSHFDIAEESYRRLVDSWVVEGAALSRSAAVEALFRAGAVEVAPR